MISNGWLIRSEATPKVFASSPAGLAHGDSMVLLLLEVRSNCGELLKRSF
jgi:hypothetical protein